MSVLSIKVPIRKKVWKLIVCTSYIYMYIYTCIYRIHLLLFWKYFTPALVDGVWVTVNLPKSPELFSVFWLISTMLQFGWSLLVLLFLSPSVLWWFTECVFFTITWSGRLADIRWSVCTTKSQRILCIDIMVRVLANGPEDLGSIPGRVMPKTQKNGTWFYLA